MSTSSFEAPAAWHAIDLLSDLHLSGQTPRSFDAWSAHLRHTSADAVFMLGDLFEYWAGDEMADTGLEARCAAVLAEAARTKAIGFMAGNRDFLVGDALLDRLGVMRLHDPTLVHAFGERVLLTHGDLLCIADTRYQRYRRVVRTGAAQRAFLALPFAWRLAGGRTMRRNARRPMQARVATAALDADPGLTRRWLEDAAAGAIVHGHTHAAARHPLDANRFRHVLGDWSLDDAAEPPRAEVLRWTAAGFARIAPEGPVAAASTPIGAGSPP